MREVNESVTYRFDFLKSRKFWLFVSVAYILIGVVTYFAKGGFNYHIDFTGGVELRIEFEKPIRIGAVRAVISGQEWGDAVIQNIGTLDKNFLVRIGKISGSEEKIRSVFNSAIPDNKMSVNNIQWVGAKAGRDTTKNAVLAVILSMLILLLYIVVRFEFGFGIGAIACLAHDLLAVLVFLLLTGVPFSLHVLASVLAVLGYSLNDTIVIYSRVRENTKKLKGASLYDIVNLSINQTLKRTLLTSFATILAVGSILFLGGEVLRGLTLVLLVGVVVGTYSSIYIASPVVLAIKKIKKA